MPFRLTYRGPLKADAGPVQKQALRRHFHGQLKQLWTRDPLLSYAQHGYLRCSPDPPGRAIYVLGGASYACMVTERLCLHCELDILFLRPSPPGALIATGGDIDNRLKTLFDGLRRPDKEAEVPGSAEPPEYPIHCLLSDDALISKISVTSDQLLEPSSPGEVLLVIGVTVVPHDVNHDNMGYIR
jgi:hypothetical protein